MRHKMKGRKLGVNHSHTKAMKVSLVQALFLNDRIKTTETRAKEVRGNVDKIITWAKKGDLHSRRLAIAALGNDKDLVREIFEKVNQGMFEGRNGGYTRIMKLGPRKGDGAPMVIMELVNETVVPKGAKAAAKATPKKKATPSKKAVKAAEADIKAEEDKAEEHHETVIEKIKDNIEAAEETFAENVREAGEKQLAEEKSAAEAADAAEEAKEEAEKAEAKAAEDAAAAAEEKAKDAEKGKVEE